MTDQEQSLVARLAPRRSELGLEHLPRVARLLAAAKATLHVLGSMSLDDLMDGKDTVTRAELIEAIREMEGG
jgi:hypothetical protein